MAIFEVVKEIFFDGELTLWESHTITVFVTATFSTVAAYFIRQQADKLTTKAQAAHRKAAGIIQNIFDAVVIIDEKGTIKTFNPAAEKIFGYKEEEVKGLNVKILMPEPYAACLLYTSPAPFQSLLSAPQARLLFPSAEAGLARYQRAGSGEHDHGAHQPPG